MRQILLLVLMVGIIFSCGAVSAEGQRYQYDRQNRFMVDSETGKVFHYVTNIEKSVVEGKDGFVEVDFVNGTVRIIRVLPSEEKQYIRF